MRGVRLSSVVQALVTMHKHTPLLKSDLQNAKGILGHIWPIRALIEDDLGQMSPPCRTSPVLASVWVPWAHGEDFIKQSRVVSIRAEVA